MELKSMRTADEERIGVLRMMRFTAILAPILSHRLPPSYSSYPMTLCRALVWNVQDKIKTIASQNSCQAVVYRISGPTEPLLLSVPKGEAEPHLIPTASKSPLLL